MSRRERRALDVYVKLHRVTELLRARSTRFFAQHGLTYTQFAVLEALHHGGSLCQRDIGTKILTSGGNLTLVLDNLERAGLVERRSPPRDRRRKVVVLTRRGDALMRRIFPPHAQRITAAISALSTAEQEGLAKLCRKLGIALAAADT